jgi:DNA replication and repair protein RecF
VRLTELRVDNLRNIVRLELDLAPGFNLFTGPNGAGKTSILEGAYLLSHGRSFRAAQTNALIRRGAEGFQLFARLERSAGPLQIGLTRRADGWGARINNADVATLSSLLKEYAQVCFEPGSHALISGGSEERRRFLDWGMFHVEPSFLACSRQYRRALSQRNALLKQDRTDAELDGWDEEVSMAAETLNELRLRYFQAYSAALVQALGTYLPELGEVGSRYAQGWPAATSMRESLRQTRALDRARGFTSRGPHRADWSIQFELAPLREHLSRGQEKLCALACVMAQARIYANARGEWPVIALDDLSSELDPPHQRVVLDSCAASGAQVLISAIDVPPCLRDVDVPTHMFHVEHGEVRSLL